MSLPPAHFLLRAREARVAAKLAPDAELRRLMIEIAEAYEDLADVPGYPDYPQRAYRVSNG